MRTGREVETPDRHLPQRTVRERYDRADSYQKIDGRSPLAGVFHTTE